MKKKKGSSMKKKKQKEEHGKCKSFKETVLDKKTIRKLKRALAKLATAYTNPWANRWFVEEDIKSMMKEDEDVKAVERHEFLMKRVAESSKGYVEAGEELITVQEEKERECKKSMQMLNEVIKRSKSKKTAETRALAEKTLQVRKLEWEAYKRTRLYLEDVGRRFLGESEKKEERSR